MQPIADCAGAMAEGTQRLMVNQAIAAIAAQYLAALVLTRQATLCEMALDLATLTAHSLPITVATIAEATGLTEHELMTLDEPRENRHGGRP